MEATTSPKQKWTLTREALDGLLLWLDPDRERAGVKYEEIRAKLINGFERHHCTDPEDLADDTISRVAKKLPEIKDNYVGDPARYFFGVAHNVHMEYLKRSHVVVSLSSETWLGAALRNNVIPLDDDMEYACLERCMEHLTPYKRELIVEYYQGEGQTKIRLRRELASKLGLTLEALRLKAQRIRETLRVCVLACLGSVGQNETV